MQSKRFLSLFLKASDVKNKSSSIPFDVLAAYLAFGDNFLAEQELEFKLKTIEKERNIRMKELKREMAALKDELINQENQFMKCQRVFSVETFISDSPLRNYLRNIHFGPRPSKGKMASGTLTRLRNRLQDFEIEGIAKSFFPRPKAIKTRKIARPQSGEPSEAQETPNNARKQSRINSAPPRTYSASNSVGSSLYKSKSSVENLMEKTSFQMNRVELKTKKQSFVKTPPQSPKRAWDDGQFRNVYISSERQENGSSPHRTRTKSAMFIKQQPNSERIKLNRPSTATTASRLSLHVSNLQKNTNNHLTASKKSSSSSLTSELHPLQKHKKSVPKENKDYFKVLETEMIRDSEEGGPIVHQPSLTDSVLCTSGQGTKYFVADLVTESLETQLLEDNLGLDKTTTNSTDMLPDGETKSTRLPPPKSGSSANGSATSSQTDLKAGRIEIQRDLRSVESTAEVSPSDTEFSRTAQTSSRKAAEKSLRKVAPGRRQSVFHPNKQRASQLATHSCRRFNKHEKRAPTTLRGISTVRGKRISLYHVRSMTMSASLARKNLDQVENLKIKVNQFLSK